MISIRKSGTELERLEELHRTAVKCYSEALHSTEQNTIELDTAQAAHFRAQLQALRDQLRADAPRNELEAVQTSFAAELKDYSGKTREQIQRLRREVEAAAAAVESFAGSINESEVNLESGIQRELTSLSQSAKSEDIAVMRGAIQASTAKISGSVQQMKSSNQLAIAQLKDEIRLLHQEVQASRRSHSADPAAESRRWMSGRIQEFIHKKSPFSMLLVVVRNLEGLENCYSSGVIDNALRAFQSRFENILPSTAIVGRWTRDQFAAILNTAPGSAIEMSSEAVGKLSAPFLEQDQGASHSIAFHPRAGVVDFSPGSDLAKFQAKLKQLADALSS
jgi:GGDEF domain-containing protein